MIKVGMERPLPADFDVLDDAQAAWRARIALDSINASGGAMRWICTYATADQKRSGLVEVESEAVIEAFRQQAGIGAGILADRVLRVLDPSTAGPPGMPPAGLIPRLRSAGRQRPQSQPGPGPAPSRNSPDGASPARSGPAAP